MSFKYLLFILVHLIIVEHHCVIANIISISSVIGTQLLFNDEILDKLVNDDVFKTIIWYKGITDLKPLINSHNLSVNFSSPNQSRYYLINQTKLFIKQTFLGDEGFYTLKIQTKSNILKSYLFHVILFIQNLSLFLSPSLSEQIPYHAEQQINYTCSISFFTDHNYIEQSRSLFFSIWSMIIYNNDPDYYQLLSLSTTSYTYISYLFNYELNRNDHNQTIFCLLIEQQKSQQILLQNQTLKTKFNIEYKTYLRGNYYFIHSFNSYSTIEINCEEFDGNPKPIYSLIWLLNGKYEILLNKTKYGKYQIPNATWQHRGNYTCFAENYLNYHYPIHQSFRLNIWFIEHQLKSFKLNSFQQYSPSNKKKYILLIIFIVIFLFVCLFFILSFYYFCLQIKYKTNQ